MAHLERTPEQRRPGYGGYSDICRDRLSDGSGIQQDNGIYLQFVILTEDLFRWMRI